MIHRLGAHFLLKDMYLSNLKHLIAHGTQLQYYSCADHLEQLDFELSFLRIIIRAGNIQLLLLIRNE